MRAEPASGRSYWVYYDKSDERLRKLLSDLGLEGTVRWTSAPAEIVSAGQGYPATSIAQMATLPVLKLSDRARIGASIAASLALPMKVANRMTAVRWLGAIAGKSALKAFWWPMLRANRTRHPGGPGGVDIRLRRDGPRFVEQGGETRVGQAVPRWSHRRRRPDVPRSPSHWPTARR